MSDIDCFSHRAAVLGTEIQMKSRKICVFIARLDELDDVHKYPMPKDGGNFMRQIFRLSQGSNNALFVTCLQLKIEVNASKPRPRVQKLKS